MAKVFVRNTSTQPIILNDGTAQVEIPGGVVGPEGFAPGFATVEDSLIAAVKKTEAGKALFAEGWLTVERGETKQEKQEKKEDKKEGE